MKIMIVGGGGRESAFARNLATDSTVYAVMAHANPTIVRCVESSGGAYHLGDANAPEVVCAFARQHAVDYVFVSADDPLANGVVDALLAAGVRAVGGVRAAARIEWDKVYSMLLVREVCPQFTPQFQVVERADELAAAVEIFAQHQLPLVVKPQGLTGGKGVKVMPQHLADYAAATAYAQELLARGEQVLLVEKLHGLEFTVMGLTDGEHLVLAPATYDYPYRFAGDTGAGTGGMGCFNVATPTLPFMQARHLEECRTIMQKVIDRMRADGVPLQGVLNGGFFLTAAGAVRFMEFNSRFGDPEALNIISVLATPLSQLIVALWEKTLTAQSVQFRLQASVVKYLVAAEYPQASPTALRFTVDEAAMAAMGVDVFYAHCIAFAGGSAGSYQTLKKSRVLAVVAVADDAVVAAERVDAAISQHVTGALEYRADIASAVEMKRLTRTN